MTAQVTAPVKEVGIEEWLNGEDATPTAPQPQAAPILLLRERIQALYNTIGTPEWSDAAAIAIGQAITNQESANKDEARKQRERKIEKAVETAYNGVYLTWVLMAQHESGWWLVGAKALGGAKHTWENKLSAMMGVHTELREVYTIWPSFYMAVGETLGIRGELPDAISKRLQEAQANVMAWAERRLLDADEEYGNPLNTTYFKLVCEYMAEHNLTEVPGDGEIPTSGKSGKDDVADQVAAYRQGVGLLAEMVDRAANELLSVASDDTIKYAMAVQTVAHWRREAKSITDALNVPVPVLAQVEAVD